MRIFSVVLDGRMHSQYNYYPVVIRASSKDAVIDMLKEKGYDPCYSSIKRVMSLEHIPTPEEYFKISMEMVKATSQDV